MADATRNTMAGLRAAVAKAAERASHGQRFSFSQLLPTIRRFGEDMDNIQAVRLVKMMRQGTPPELDFIAPAVATILAALRLKEHELPRPIFLNRGMTYAATIGLLDVMDGKLETNNARRLHGQSYSRLTLLYDSPHVEECSSTINSVFSNQLVGYDVNLLSQLAYVVGELHDNVVSHAKFSGFSAAQTYARPSGTPGHRVIFAVADGGVGLLRNVQKVRPEIKDHGEAIAWCLQKGNTTAARIDSFAQTAYNDVVRVPFGANVSVRSRECDHRGYGLSELCDIVDKTDGEFWMWTGDTQYHRKKGVGYYTKSEVSWSGLAIELELRVTPDTKTSFEGFGIEDVFCGR